jgi:hypothetical protein
LMTIAPDLARSLPTSRAASSCDGVASLAPHTATYRRGIEARVYSVDFRLEVQRPWGKGGEAELWIYPVVVPAASFASRELGRKAASSL